MDKHEIKEELARMSNCDYMSFNITKSEAKVLIKGLEGNYEVTELSEEKCLIVKTDKIIRTLNEIVIEAVGKLNFLTDVPVIGSYMTVRGIIYKFNKANDRKVSVRNVKGSAVLSEDFTSRESITQDEYDQMIVRMEEIKKRMKNRLEGGDINDVFI